MSTIARHSAQGLEGVLSSYGQWRASAAPLLIAFDPSDRLAPAQLLFHYAVNEIGADRRGLITARWTTCAFISAVITDVSRSCWMLNDWSRSQRARGHGGNTNMKWTLAEFHLSLTQVVILSHWSVLTLKESTRIWIIVIYTITLHSCCKKYTESDIFNSRLLYISWHFLQIFLTWQLWLFCAFLLQINYLQLLQKCKIYFVNVKYKIQKEKYICLCNFTYLSSWFKILNYMKLNYAKQKYLLMC